jgi:hypothetical protein
MVDLQVGKQTPFSKDEIIYDHQILDSNPDGYSRVMLAIVHQDIISRYFKILEGVDLKPEKISLSSEGLFGWCKFACKQEVADQAYALINVGYEIGDFTVVLKDKLIFCRNISVGLSTSLERMEQWPKKFIEEINHSIYAYQNEMVGQQISKIIVTSSEALRATLNETIMQEKFDLPIEVIPQLENIPLAKDVWEADETAMKNMSVSYLCGLALTFGEQKINLIPQQIRIERGVRERGKELYLMGIYLVFILATISSIFFGRMYNKEQYLKLLKREILNIKGDVDQLSIMIKETKALKKRADTKNFSLNFIYEIHKVISPDIYLTVISFDGKGQLILRGTSNLMSEIFKFRDALEESKYFQNVKSKYATQRKDRGKEVADFEFVCPLDERVKRQLMEE